MKLLILLLLLVSTLSCKQNAASVTPKISEAHLFQYFQVNLKKIDSTMSMDSVRIIRVDTVTRFDLTLLKHSDILDKVASLNKKNKSIIKEMEENVSLARLAAGISAKMLANYTDEINKGEADAKENYAEIQVYLAEADSLFKLSDHVDTLKPVLYRAVSKYQFRRMDKSVLRDTAYTYFNLSYDIVNRDDIFKY